MGISFLKGLPALMVDEEKLIAVGDLHIGMEDKFADSGVAFPNAAKLMGSEIRKACSANGARGVILLGDVKHRLTNMTREELRSLAEFFHELRGINVMIAKGNHDAYIESLVRELGFSATIEKEILLSDCALMHGNAMPSDAAVMKRYVICGHGHIAAQINGIDKKAWLIAPAGDGMAEHYQSYNKGIKLVATPAFNRLIVGSRIGYESEEHIPMLNNRVFDFSKAKVYDLYGNLVR